MGDNQEEEEEEQLHLPVPIAIVTSGSSTFGLTLFREGGSARRQRVDVGRSLGRLYLCVRSQSLAMLRHST